MKRNYLVIASIIIMITLLHCSEDPVSVIDNGFKDRNITWSADTLDLQEHDWMRGFFRSWGANPDDIWITASSTSIMYELWHYDGETWKPASSESFYPASRAIYGFSENDIWFNAGFGHIYHFDGAEWEKQCTLKVDGYNAMAIQNIWGKSANDICAVGFVENIGGDEINLLNTIGVVFHYDGSIWKHNYISEEGISSFNQIYYDNSEQSYILWGSSNNSFPHNKLYKYDPVQNTITEFYNSDNGLTMFHIDGEVYLMEKDSGNNIFFFSVYNNYIQRIYEFSGTELNYIIGGLSADDLFCRLKDGIGHFNGENIELLYECDIDSVFVQTPMIFQDEVFFGIKHIYDNTSYILHGIKQ